MSETEPDYTIQEYRQELQTYMDCIKKRDFESANALSNRIMSNAWAFDKKSFGIFAFFQKQFAMIAISSPNKSKDSVSKSIISFSNHILTSSSNESYLKYIWSDFCLTFEEIRSYILSEQEIKYYELNPAITSNILKKLVKVLLDEKEILKYKRNKLLASILNETTRNASLYGIKEHDIRIFSLLQMIYYIYEYVDGTSTNDDFKDRIENELFPLIVGFESTLNNYSDNSVDDSLWNMIKIWRLYFIKFMESQESTNNLIINPKEVMLSQVSNREVIN